MTIENVTKLATRSWLCMYVDIAKKYSFFLFNDKPHNLYTQIYFIYLLSNALTSSTS